MSGRLRPGGDVACGFRCQIKRGVVLAIVPLDEYEELREALADAEAMRCVREDPDEEDVPIAFAKRLWNGESPVRVWREMRGMKATDLAAAADVSRSTSPPLRAAQSVAP